MNERDAIGQRWFDANSVRIEVAPAAQGFFDDEAFIGLSGALSNSTVKVDFPQSYIEMEVIHPAVRRMRRRLYFDIDTNQWNIENIKFRIRPEYWGQDLAARSIAVQASTAKNFGMGALSAYAMGNFQTANHPSKDERWSGYWVWPRLGFDGDIPVEIQQKLSGNLRHCKRLSDLMVSEAGREEWLRLGGDVEVRFDLSAGSISWQIFNRYTSERGIRM